jgi:transposase
MLSQNQRTTILELHSQGVSKRAIARTLGISRLSVRKVLKSNSSTLPVLVRPERAEAYRMQIPVAVHGRQRHGHRAGVRSW